MLAKPQYKIITQPIYVGACKCKNSLKVRIDQLFDGCALAGLGVIINIMNAFECTSYRESRYGVIDMRSIKLVAVLVYSQTI